MVRFSGFGTSEEDLEWAIRQVLIRTGHVDTSRCACQRWAREFIQQLLPGWMPGTPLLPASRMRIGAAFMTVLTEHRLLRTRHDD